MNDLQQRRHLLKAIGLGGLTFPLSSVAHAAMAGTSPEKQLASAHTVKPLWPDWSKGHGWADNKTPASAKDLPSPTLSVYENVKPENAKPVAVLVLPGGAYARHAAHEGPVVAQWLNENGHVAAVVNYRVAPHGHPYPLVDARRALRMFRLQLRSMPSIKKVVVLGFSAGGHLCSCLATLGHLALPVGDDLAYVSGIPDAVALGYPVISMMVEPHLGSMKNLLGPAFGPEPSPEVLKQFSTDLQVTSFSPPAFLFHTATDAGVPVSHSMSYAAACYQNRVPAELHVFPEGRHGLGLAKDHPVVKQWPALLLTWLEQLGK